MLNTNEVRIETCTKCNYKCKFCPHSTTFKREKIIMSNSMFFMLLKKIKEQAPQITECTISGFGEAFLDPELINKIYSAQLLGYNIHILTNGSLLNKKIIDQLFKTQIKDIRISLHTIFYKEYKKITGASLRYFNNVLMIIDYIIHHPKKLDTKLILTCDVIKENDKNINYLIQRYANNVDLLEIWRPHNWGNWGNYRKNTRDKISCGRPENGPIQIQVDGTVNMCCFDYNGELLLGDLKIQSLQEIFSSEPIKRIKNFHSNIESKDTILCSSCDQLCENGEIIIYNSKFGKERINKLSTTYEDVI